MSYIFQLIYYNRTDLKAINSKTGSIIYKVKRFLLIKLLMQDEVVLNSNYG